MTRKIQVVRHLTSPADEVYAMFADSERLGSLPGVRVSVLQDAPAGQPGVLRRVGLPGGVVLTEEITGLEAGRTYDYLIHEARPRFRHEGGRVSFRSTGEGTTVTWTSTFSIPAGPLTPLIERALGAATKTAFGAALGQIDRHLVRHAG
jgi:uncharacterized membrane protein